ncbi:MAG TPA: hypothetical protein VFV23_06115 [Verrucomicrobiae bacterium]|nr:hypothetical protein [Verrucomicrobiae bacterium]
MVQQNKCPVCSEKSALADHYRGGSYKLNCVRCGLFEIGDISAHEISCWNSQQRINLSGWIRENQNCKIFSPSLKDLANLPNLTVNEKAEKILIQLAHKFPKPGEIQDLSGPTYLEFMAVGRLTEISELRFFIHDYLYAEMGFLIRHPLVTELGDDSRYSISPKGWAFINSLKKQNPTNDNATETMNAYVDPHRLEELRKISNSKFDVSKLIKLCEELNQCLNLKCYFSMIMLTRAIIDHVPPIFDCSLFSEIANNYAGSKSFRESMQHLENSSRKIADQHLHCKIRKSETIPTFTQVNFHNDLDVLLAEIVRLLK